MLKFDEIALLRSSRGFWAIYLQVYFTDRAQTWHAGRGPSVIDEFGWFLGRTRFGKPPASRNRKMGFFAYLTWDYYGGIYYGGFYYGGDKYGGFFQKPPN